MRARPILYSFRRCPYAMRARMAVLASGITITLREVVLRNKPAELLAASPKGTVPVLVLPDGCVIDESLDIMRWALGQNDPGDWLGRCDDALIAANDGPFKQALDRYKYPHRYGLADPQPYREAGLGHLQSLEARLGEAAWLSGAEMGMSDVAIFPFVRQFAATDSAWFDSLPLPHIRRWLSAMVSGEAFAVIMHRYPPWQAGQDDVVFPKA